MPEMQARLMKALQAALGDSAEFEFETAPEWLRRPGLDEIGECWEIVSEVYGDLTGLVLPEVAPLRERRRLDAIVTIDGVSRVVEFDEKQHFTSARLQTLGYYEGAVPVAFDTEHWRQCCIARLGKEPRGGFAAPKPPLFPGDGGRHRQRAFRDFLADLLPLKYAWLPTVRFEIGEVATALRTASPDEVSGWWESRISPLSPTADVHVPVQAEDAEAPEVAFIAQWWGDLDRSVQERLIDLPFEPINDYCIKAILRAGGPGRGDESWGREKGTSHLYLSAHAVEWIRSTGEVPRHRDIGPDPRAAYFQRKWPRR